MNFETGSWLNEPPIHRIDRDMLIARSAAKTDFWRQTHYGFIRDTGHFLAFPVAQDFTAELVVEGDFSTLYDQAGLMLRSDERIWVKAGAEFSDGSLHLSTVVTAGRSDWSISRSLGDLRAFGIRMTLAGNALRVQASTDMQRWDLIRLAPFEAGSGLSVGPMFCSPERSDLEVRFSGFRIGDAIGSDLHATE